MSGDIVLVSMRSYFLWLALALDSAACCSVLASTLIAASCCSVPLAFIATSFSTFSIRARMRCKVVWMSPMVWMLST